MGHNINQDVSVGTSFKNTFKEYKGIHIPTTVGDWKIYDNHNSRLVAKKLTAALRMSIHLIDTYAQDRSVSQSVSDAYYTGVYEVMWSHDNYGALDTGPVAVAHKCLTDYAALKIGGPITF